MGKLNSLLEKGFGVASFYTDDECRRYGNANLNCCERILRGASLVYEMNLSEESLRVSAPFGGGMGIGSVCGAITGALMVLGVRYCEKVEKTSPLKEQITVPFLKVVRRRQGGLSCRYNKEKYATKEPFDCSAVIFAVAQALDDTIEQIDRRQEKSAVE